VPIFHVPFHLLLSPQTFTRNISSVFLVILTKSMITVLSVTHSHFLIPLLQYCFLHKTIICSFPFKTPPLFSHLSIFIISQKLLIFFISPSKSFSLTSSNLSSYQIINRPSLVFFHVLIISILNAHPFFPYFCCKSKFYPYSIATDLSILPPSTIPIFSILFIKITTIMCVLYLSILIIYTLLFFIFLHLSKKTFRPNPTFNKPNFLNAFFVSFMSTTSLCKFSPFLCLLQNHLNQSPLFPSSPLFSTNLIILVSLSFYRFNVKFQSSIIHQR